MAEFGLIMPFKGDCDDPLFVRGFECGEIWKSLENNEKFEGHPVHKENEEQLRMILDRFLYEYEFQEYDDQWCFLTAHPSEKQN